MSFGRVNVLEKRFERSDKETPFHQSKTGWCGNNASGAGPPRHSPIHQLTGTVIFLPKRLL